jgi:hypothetical protein
MTSRDLLLIIVVMLVLYFLGGAALVHAGLMGVAWGVGICGVLLALMYLLCLLLPVPRAERQRREELAECYRNLAQVEDPATPRVHRLWGHSLVDDRTRWLERTGSDLSHVRTLWSRLPLDVQQRLADTTMEEIERRGVTFSNWFFTKEARVRGRDEN